MLKVFDYVKMRRPRKEDVELFLKVQDDIEGNAMLGNTYQQSEDSILNSIINQEGWDNTYIIEVKKVAAGYICLGGFDAANKVSGIAAYLLPEYRSKGILFVAAYMFLDKMFTFLSIHKFSICIFGFNKRNLNNFKELKPEAILKEKRMYDGKYYDEYIYSLFKRDWDACYKEWLFDKVKRVDNILNKKLARKELLDKQ